MKTWHELVEEKTKLKNKPYTYLELSGVECPVCKRELYKTADNLNTTEYRLVRPAYKYTCLHHSCMFEKTL